MAESPKTKINLDRLLFVRYSHPNLANANKFLVDFGLIPVLETPERIFYRGFGPDSFLYFAEASKNGKRSFSGGGWAVKSYADLEAAAKLPGASPIHDLKGPGGGQLVSIPDPVGVPFVVVYGQTRREISAEEKPKPVSLNTWESKPRKGEFQRFEIGPSKVHKLGHYGIEVKPQDFARVLEWYTTTFNLTPTDSLYHAESGKDVMTFCHLDKGDEFVDHHSFFVAAAPPNAAVPNGFLTHHASFEVDDVDSELVGHHYLESRGWTNCFGIGRHLLGSQIFDYWFDSSGFVLEHYVDGDLVNAQNKPTREVAVPETIATWGPNVPLAFLTRQIEDVGKGEPIPLHPQTKAIAT